ncbi:hypothetical protein MKX34_23685 [Paenibacillus sp. FSL R5-0636]|uniref:hypothetical protein n=1 Tax=Paenibacillus sp. FSL L8-0696 TaxID=2954524 RepID=UPI00211709F3|nr:hypothetical protein [Paenibacillus odorifer]
MLTGLSGEKLGVASREEALAMARSQGAYLVCTSPMSSLPPCSLMAKDKEKRRRSRRIPDECPGETVKRRSRNCASPRISKNIMMTRSFARQTNISALASRYSWSLEHRAQRKPLPRRQYWSV